MDGMNMVWCANADTWAMRWVCTELTRVKCMRKMTCEVYLSTPPVGYSGSPSTVNETNCIKKDHFKKQLVWAPPTPVGRVPPRVAGGRVPYPVLCWRNWFCNVLTWLTMKTVFERDCRSKIWSKSHKRVFAWLIQGEIPLTLVYFEILCREMVRVILFCQFVHLHALLFCPANFELWITIDLVSEKTVVNTCKLFTLRVNFLTASLPRIPSQVVLSLYFGFAMPSTMSRSFIA